jgi:hypothetical protein
MKLEAFSSKRGGKRIMPILTYKLVKNEIMKCKYIPSRTRNLGKHVKKKTGKLKAKNNLPTYTSTRAEWLDRNDSGSIVKLLLEKYL